MTAEFAKRFADLVEELASVHGIYPSPALGRGIWKVLDDAGISDADCEKAMERAMRVWEKWHPPAALKALALDYKRQRTRLVAEDAMSPRGEPTPEWNNLKARLKAEIGQQMPVEDAELLEKKAEVLRTLDRLSEGKSHAP